MFFPLPRSLKPTHARRKSSYPWGAWTTSLRISEYHPMSRREGRSYRLSLQIVSPENSISLLRRDMLPTVCPGVCMTFRDSLPTLMTSPSTKVLPGVKDLKGRPRKSMSSLPSMGASPSCIMIMAPVFLFRNSSPAVWPGCQWVLTTARR